jgi:glycosyltransferase involved in cell wall biosynthesis
MKTFESAVHPERSSSGRDQTRVAFVAHWDWVLAHFRLDVAKRLQSEGHEVVMICPDGDYRPALEAAGFRWIEWRVSRRSMNPLTEVRSLAQLTSIYRREGFDLVHHFTIKPNLYGSLAGWRARVPSSINTFSGLGFAFSPGLRPAVARVVTVTVLRVVARRRSCWTIVQNEHDWHTLVNARATTGTRCRLIPGSGVDTSVFFPAATPRSGTVRVLMAGRLLESKGVPELVDAAARLEREGTPIEVWVAGTPDPGNPRSLTEERISQWQATHTNVRFLGQTQDVASLLRQVDIAVLPTSYGEGLPRFLLEAAATGLPLVATNVPGCTDIARPDRNAIVIPPGDVPALVDALRSLVNDPDRRSKLGMASRQIVVDEYSAAAIEQEYLELYRDMARM